LAKTEVENAPQRAEAIFQRMKKFEGGIRPSLYTYNSLILAWVNSKQPDAMQKAEAIYEEMIKLSSGDNGDPDTKPDGVTYATLLNGFSRRYNEKEMVHRAEAMLEQLISHYRSGASDVKPNSYMFNSVITIYARLGKVDDAARILHRMKTLNADGTLPDVTPTIVTYNVIIVACSSVSKEDERERRKILSLASFLLNEIEHSKSVEADSYTYGELFTVCHNMITDEEERTKSFLDLFHRCCRNGQVNNFVISRFFAADAPHAAVFKQVFGPYMDEKYFVDIFKLPKDWCRNAISLSRFDGTKNYFDKSSNFTV
jgi:pentatricopeptide repeat protein